MSFINLPLFSCHTIALGNGKGCRETESLITQMKNDGKLKDDVVYRYNHNHITIQGPVVRRLDSAIQRIAIFLSFLKQVVNRSDSNQTLLILKLNYPFISCQGS